jgi:hypothetical protein
MAVARCKTKPNRFAVAAALVLLTGSIGRTAVAQDSGPAPPGQARPPATGEPPTGVIKPPAGLDPQIQAPVPNPHPNTTPVIPPPGTPGGDPNVQPK